MSKTDTGRIIILIILAVVIAALGTGAGIFYQMQKNAPDVKKAAAAEIITKTLTSKTVTSITGYGQVKKIEGRNITLNNAGDSLTVHIADDAQIFSFSPAPPSDKNKNGSAARNGSTAPIQEKVNFEDVKLGDSLSINLKFLPDGKFEGSSVIIFQQY